MRIQTILAMTFFTLTTVSVSATAAIINQVDYPAAFITVKEQVVNTTTTGNVSVSDFNK